MKTSEVPPYESRDFWWSVKQLALIPVCFLLVMGMVAAGYVLLAPWRWLGELLHRLLWGS